MAHACGHPHKSHYSNGMCQNCYLAKYYLKRKTKQEQKTKDKSGEKSQTCSENTNAESAFGSHMTSIQIDPKVHQTALKSNNLKSEKIDNKGLDSVEETHASVQM